MWKQGKGVGRRREVENGKLRREVGGAEESGSSYGGGVRSIGGGRERQRSHPFSLSLRLVLLPLLTGGDESALAPFRKEADNVCLKAHGSPIIWI